MYTFNKMFRLKNCAIIEIFNNGLHAQSIYSYTHTHTHTFRVVLATISVKIAQWFGVKLIGERSWVQSSAVIPILTFKTYNYCILLTEISM